MPFQYTPYRNQYVGSIADLMGRGRDAEAHALLTAAHAQAQAAQVSGQAWGGAVQGIGNIVSQGITDWNSPEARRQRAMDDARKVYELGTADTRPAMVEDVIGKRDPERVPTRSMLESATSGLNLFSPERQSGVEYGESFDPAPPSNLDAIAQSTQNLPLPTFGQQTPYEGSSDTIMQPFADRGSKGRTGMVEKLDASGEPVMRGRYTLDNGQYDSAALLEDLIAAGIPLDVANEFAAQGVQANQIIAAGADIAKQYRESQLAIQGEVAGMALTAIETFPEMSPEDAVNQATPGGDVIPADQLRQFRVMFHQKTPEEQVQILREIQRRASFLGETTVIPRGATMVGAQGEPLAWGQSAATPARLGSLEDMMISWFGSNPTPAQKEAGLRKYEELKELPVLSINDINLSHLDLQGVGAIQVGSGNASAVAPGNNGMAGSGGRDTDYLNQGVPGGTPPARPPIGVNPPPAVSDVPAGAPQGEVPQRDPEFQTFATYEEGRQAAKDLLLTEPYQTRTVRDAVARWTGGPGAAPDGYMNEMLESVGAGVGDRPTPQREKMMSEVTPDELEKFLDVQQKWEGWHPGAMHGPPVDNRGPSRSFRLNNPGNIKRTDNRGITQNIQPPPMDDALVQQIANDFGTRIPPRVLPDVTQPPETAAIAEPPSFATGPAAQDPVAPTPSVATGRAVQDPIAPTPSRMESRPGEYTRDSPQAYVMRHAGPTPTDAERRQLEAEYQLFKDSAIAAAADPSVGPSSDPFANELGIRPNSDGVYNMRPLSPVMTPNLGDTIKNSMDFAMSGMTSGEKKDTIEKFARFAEQRQPAHVMKHLVYTTGLEGLGVDERNQIKGRYTTQLALRGIVSILGEMKEEGVNTGWLTGNIENLYAMIGKTNNPELARLSTRLADMVIAYRRAATGVQFGITEKKDYENMMPGIKFEENLNLARIGGLNTAMNDHARAFWEQRIGGHNAPTMFPEFYPSEPNYRDFVPGEARILEDGTRWAMGPEGEDPIPYPFEEKELNGGSWFSREMFTDILDKIIGSGGQVDPSEPPSSFWN